MCATFRKKFIKCKQPAASVSSESDQSDQDKMDASESLNSSLTSIGFFPLKFQQMSQRNSLGYAKRKISQVQDVVVSKIASIGGFKPGDITQSKTPHCEMCKDYNHLLADLKQKLHLFSQSKKIQILTLALENWSIKTTSIEFGLSERMVKQDRKLKSESGILAIPGN